MVHKGKLFLAFRELYAIIESITKLIINPCTHIPKTL